jgi:hypothetical protein
MFIESYDNIKILEKLQLSFMVGNDLKYNRLFDSGVIYFLTGLMLKKEKNSLPDPPLNALNNLVTALLYYIDHYYLKVFERIKNESSDAATKEFKVKFFNYKLLNQVNYGGYQYQYDEFGNNVFGKMDSFFLGKIGFTFSHAIEFIKFIESFLTTKFDGNSRIIRDEVGIPEPGKKIDPKELYNLPLFNIEIDPSEIQRINSLDNDSIRRVIKFLDFLSVKFGEQYPGFNNLFDRNILFDKPIIKMNGSYYCPTMPLLWDHHIYFSNVMRSELINKTRAGEKYTHLKSDYLEDKVEEYLKRIFPSEAVFSNLYYFPKKTNNSFETDILVKHGNTIIIMEAKTGELSEASLRGAPKSLVKDLSQMLGKAYAQGKRVQDFILDEEPAKFYNNDKSKLLLQIEKTNHLKFIICSLTLYPLRALTTNITDLDTLQLFPTGKYPLNFSLFDIDILTQFIPTGGLLIDFLNKRSNFDSNNPLLGSEIQFLNFYLKKQSFEGLESVTNPKALHDPFDSFYLLGKEKPKLQLNQNILKLVSAIDDSVISEKDDVINAILSTDKVYISDLSKLISKHLRNASNPNVLTYKIHDYMLFFSFVNKSSEFKALKTETLAKINHQNSKSPLYIEYDISEDKYANISSA